MSDLRSDEQLIADYLGGDDNSFEQLVLRYQNRIYNLCYRYMGSASDAEDVTQDIFLSLITRLSGFRGEAKFSTWLYRLATNRCLDALRTRKGEAMDIDDLDLPGTDSVEAAVLQHASRDEIIFALNQMPSDFKVAAVLRDVEGLSYEEMSRVLEVPIGTIKSRINRGRAILAQILSRSREQNSGAGV